MGPGVSEMGKEVEGRRSRELVCVVVGIVVVFGVDILGASWFKWCWCWCAFGLGEGGVKSIEVEEEREEEGMRLC